MTIKRSFVPNQIFVGLPWKNVRPKYERVIRKLENKYPLYFTIVGRNDGQNAQDLFEIIKERVSSSSYAIFDATGGNANVSLEFGYAEGLDVPRAIFLSSHKSAQKISVGGPIITDLVGQRRTQYKTERALSTELHKLCRDHDYTKRFENALTSAPNRKTKGKKRRSRTLAIKLVHVIDGKKKIRRADLVQGLQAQKFTRNEIDAMLRHLNKSAIIHCAAGKYSVVSVA